MPISYSWKRADGRGFVSGTKISDRGRVLTIANAPLEAEGGYICKAKGQGGVAYKTISLVMESKFVSLRFVPKSRELYISDNKHFQSRITKYGFCILQ